MNAIAITGIVLSVLGLITVLLPEDVFEPKKGGTRRKKSLRKSRKHS
jgi:hypothetical protein